jgi:glycosyltransferase involved in cell wall biosynthesis
MPLVSVIIPSKNAGARLAEAIASATMQTHADVEIILVDDASTDDSIGRARETLASSGRPHAIVHGGGKGVSNARNVGLSHARGDFIQWLDADDEIAASKIARQLEAVSTNGHVAVSDYAFVTDVSGRRSLNAVPIAMSDDPLLDFLLGLAPQIGSFLFPRPLADRLSALGVFDLRTTVAEDREYVTLAALLGARFEHVPLVSLLYFWSPNASQRSTGRAFSASLTAIHARLRAHAETVSGVTLTDEHRWGLAQDFRLYEWRVKEIVTSPWWKPTARLRNGRDVELSVLEAAIVKRQDETMGGASLERIARAMCEAGPELSYRLLDVRRALDSLAARGLLTTVSSGKPRA